MIWAKSQELSANSCFFMDFKLVSDYKPQGDQGSAIKSLVCGVFDREQHQVLLGVTGSGKTYTMAKVIEAANRPSIVMAHNKTLAAQLYHEFKSFFLRRRRPRERSAPVRDGPPRSGPPGPRGAGRAGRQA